MNEIVKLSDVQDRIITIREQNVILDSDVAELYSVETREVNQAVKNNPNKFPDGYVFKINKKEKEKVIKIFDNPKIKFSPTLPNSITEKGCYMLATILKGEKATNTTIEIIEAFAQLRELQKTVLELSQSPDEYQQKTLMQKSGEIMSELIGENLSVTDSETTVELNLALLKFKHTIKRKKE